MAGMINDNRCKCALMTTYEDALERLKNHLGAERIIQLADLIEEMKTKTGWGGVDIVIAEGRIVTMKQEISHK